MNWKQNFTKCLIKLKVTARYKIIDDENHFQGLLECYSNVGFRYQNAFTFIHDDTFYEVRSACIFLFTMFQVKSNPTKSASLPITNVSWQKMIKSKTKARSKWLSTGRSAWNDPEQLSLKVFLAMTYMAGLVAFQRYTGLMRPVSYNPR